MSLEEKVAEEEEKSLEEKVAGLFGYANTEAFAKKIFEDIEKSTKSLRYEYYLSNYYSVIELIQNDLVMGVLSPNKFIRTVANKINKEGLEYSREKYRKAAFSERELTDSLKDSLNNYDKLLLIEHLSIWNMVHAQSDFKSRGRMMHYRWNERHKKLWPIIEKYIKENIEAMTNCSSPYYRELALLWSTNEETN